MASNAEKIQLVADHISAKSRDGPSKSIRGQLSMSDSKRKDSYKSTSGTAGLLDIQDERPRANLFDHPSSSIMLWDGRATINVVGRCDDSSDDLIVLLLVAKAVVVKGIEKMCSIESTKLQVALKTGSVAETFTFSRTWTAARTILHLAVG